MLSRARLGYNLPTMISISLHLKEKTKTTRLITAHLLILGRLIMAHHLILGRLIMTHHLILGRLIMAHLIMAHLIMARLITESPTTHPIITRRT
jgi:hypothetical protein